MRFTLDGSNALEKRIADDMEAIRSLVVSRVDEDSLSGLVLGGGYGRGEGAVYEVDGEERVYNDYDFFVLTPSRSLTRPDPVMKALAEVKSIMEPRCGIHVDFSPAMPMATLPSLPYELMFMELKQGHHVVIGSPDILSTMPAYDAARPPLEECSRLFMNRGMGLFLARNLLDRNEPLDRADHEFVVRNIRKAQLAMGDSVLFLAGCYNPSYVERLSTFRSLKPMDVPNWRMMTEYYEEAMAFKLRPSHDGFKGNALSNLHAEVLECFETVFLWFERHRLQDPELNWDSYQQLDRRLPSKGLQEDLKNMFRNLRLATPQLPVWKNLHLHPRDRVLSQLPSLLFTEERDPKISADVQHLWEYCG